MAPPYRFAALAALALLLCAPPCAADIFRRVDEDGVVYFTNRPAKGRKWKRVMQSRRKRTKRKRPKVDAVPARDRSKERYTRYMGHIRQAAALYHIPVPLVQAVISVESDYDPRVVSRAGAKGMMQLMPSIVKGMGVTDPFNPRQNIFGGTRLLRILANRFDGDLVLTLAAYHAGSGAVRKYNGIPPYQSTQQYVRWVLSRYYRFKRKAAQVARKQ